MCCGELAHVNRFFKGIKVCRHKLFTYFVEVVEPFVGLVLQLAQEGRRFKLTIRTSAISKVQLFVTFLSQFGPTRRKDSARASSCEGSVCSLSYRKAKKLRKQ